MATVTQEHIIAKSQELFPLNFADRKKQRKMRLYSKKLNMASNKLTQFVTLIAVENSDFLYANFYICN